MLTNKIEEQVFLPCLFEKDPVVIDLGARFGEFTFPFLKKYGGKVVCYEPVRSSVEKFKGIRRSLGYTESSAPIFQQAVSYEEKIRELYIWDDGLTSLFPNQPTNKKVGEVFSSTETISVIPFSQISSLYQQIDLLKMDIEGAEFDILSKSPKSTFQNIKQIAFEAHFYCSEKFLFKNMWDLLSDIDFDIFYTREIGRFAIISAVNKSEKQYQ